MLGFFKSLIGIEETKEQDQPTPNSPSLDPKVKKGIYVEFMAERVYFDHSHQIDGLSSSNS